MMSETNRNVQTSLMISEIIEELARARKLFPNSEGSMCALTEEVGELAKAMLDEPLENVRKEAIQVAVMAIRVAIDGDSTLHSIRLRRVYGGKP